MSRGQGLAFGDCVFDPVARLLTRRGQAVPLSPKAYALLAALLAKRPAALSQAELRDRLWPHSAVGYTSLPRVVTELRKVIGDGSRSPRFIRTVRGFGYAFAGGSAEPAAKVVWALFWSSQLIPLLPGENLIGRGLDCRLRIESSWVSRHHALIRVEGDRATIEDLGSKNGTVLNARTLDAPAPLVDGDEITIGSEVIVFRAAGDLSTTETGTR